MGKLILSEEEKKRFEIGPYEDSNVVFKVRTKELTF